MQPASNAVEIELRLNPALDPERYAAHYAEHKWVQIGDLFEPHVADAMERVVATLPWRLSCQNDKHEQLLLTSEQLAAMSPAERNAFMQGIYQRASRNLGFTYFMYPMIEAIIENREPGHPIHHLTQFLNSAEFLDFARKLIRCPGLTKVDAHASKYTSGHYLTRHVDEGANQERRAAYTISLSKRWEPDWGGLLLFLNQERAILRGFTPRFNTLNVFDGRQIHAVSCVAPFAAQPRLSIAGWFRDDK